MGDATLRVTNEVAPFAERFAALFADCAIDGAQPYLPAVECALRWGSGSEIARAEITGPAPLDLEDFARGAFPDREVSGFSLDAPWRGLAVRGGSGETRCGWHGEHLTVLSGDAWPSFLGSLLVAYTMRLQPSVAFVHAGSVAIGGRGVMICGPKGSGKTTLTLSLGAGGHTVLGDEVAAIRVRPRELLPYRRAASVRPGPTSRAAAALLARKPWSEELFADGQPRKRVPISELFPASRPPEPTRLSALIIPTGMGPTASIERVRTGPEQARHVNLLGASLWDLAPPVRAFKLLSTVSGIPCFAVRCGPVEDTCRLIEGAVET